MCDVGSEDVPRDTILFSSFRDGRATFLALYFQTDDLSDQRLPFAPFSDHSICKVFNVISTVASLLRCIRQSHYCNIEAVRIIFVILLTTKVGIDTRRNVHIRDLRGSFTKVNSPHERLDASRVAEQENRPFNRRFVCSMFEIG